MNWGGGDFQFLKSGSDEPCIQPIESSQLGLAIVERLLKHVGGSLRMLPRQGGGLIARIELPKAKFRNYQLDSENQ
ncbi:two component system sensor kinase [Bordetella pertussis]|nr:ATP-binding protein [Bordetella pertussis]SUV77046.1 two component system sensor kinase [Bordetella pertussis]SUV93661.1 two component system sensor kinase [Bordetella pertussis]